MTALPAASAFTGSSITEGQFKQAITEQRDFLNGLLGADGTKITGLKTLGALFNDTLAKSAAYTVVAADKGKLITCTGTWTLTLTAAATLGDGFAVIVKNDGTGTITVDADLSETINGATTIALNGGDSCVLFCTGTAWHMFDQPATTAEMQAGTETKQRSMSPKDIADAIAALSPEQSTNYGAIGTYVVAFESVANNTIRDVNTTVAGSSLYKNGSPASASYTLGIDNVPTFTPISAGLSGTWRRMSKLNNFNSGAAAYLSGIYVRVS